MAGLSLLTPACNEPIAPVPATPQAIEPARLPEPPRLSANLLSRLPASKAEVDALLRTGGAPDRWFEEVDEPELGRVAVHYSFEPALTDTVFRLLRGARVGFGHVLVADARDGRILAYASTDTERFSPRRTYPAASLVKVITAAALLEQAPEATERECIFRGRPYRLTPARLEAPQRGRQVSFARALATSNNQCFAQWAVHELGASKLLAAIDRFGWSGMPAAGHAVGIVDRSDEPFALGQLGSGLDGAEITPLHALRLALALADGELREPHWIERVVTPEGRVIEPAHAPGPRAMRAETARALRGLLVETTVRGTARRAFLRRNGRPLLQHIDVAGKTGSLSGDAPSGRYQWFIGVAPADDPEIAIAVVQVVDHFYIQTASQLAAETLRYAFCPSGVCRREAVDRLREGSAGE